jgi:hypothetical protein
MKVTTSTVPPFSGRTGLRTRQSGGPAARAPAHVLAHAQLLARDLVVLHQPGALEDVAPGLLQVDHMHIGKARLQALLDEDLGRRKSRPYCGSCPGARGQLHLLVFEQAAHQLGARVLGFVGPSAWAAAACAT